MTSIAAARRARAACSWSRKLLPTESSSSLSVERAASESRCTCVRRRVYCEVVAARRLPRVWCDAEVTGWSSTSVESSSVRSCTMRSRGTASSGASRCGRVNMRRAAMKSPMLSGGEDRDARGEVHVRVQVDVRVRYGVPSATMRVRVEVGSARCCARIGRSRGSNIIERREGASPYDERCVREGRCHRRSGCVASTRTVRVRLVSLPVLRLHALCSGVQPSCASLLSACGARARESPSLRSRGVLPRRSRAVLTSPCECE
jgi:hypothetical protein